MKKSEGFRLLLVRLPGGGCVYWDMSQGKLFRLDTCMNDGVGEEANEQSCLDEQGPCCSICCCFALRCDYWLEQGFVRMADTRTIEENTFDSLKQLKAALIAIAATNIAPKPAK